ncbi:MAG: hypothetical protein EB084_05460 [Proteobacteria bacterium]|nr:hypothetical protein [Pseudomonadota bacterium]
MGPMQMSIDTAIDNLRVYGVSDENRASLRTLAWGTKSAEETLARVGRTMSIVIDNDHDRVEIGTAILTEMTHLPLDARMRAQVEAGQRLLGRGTDRDLFTQRTVFAGLLEETAAVRVPLPATRGYLQMSLTGHDTEMATANRRIVDDLTRTADEQQAKFAELRETHETQKADIAQHEAAEKRYGRLAAVAKGVCALGGVGTVAAVGMVACGVAGAAGGISLGLSVASAAYLLMYEMRIMETLKSMRVSTTQMLEGFTRRSLEDAQRKRDDAVHDLAIAAPHVEAAEAAHRAVELERLARIAAAPAAEGHIESAGQWVTINGMRVPRRTEQPPSAAASREIIA